MVKPSPFFARRSVSLEEQKTWRINNCQKNVRGGKASCHIKIVSELRPSKIHLFLLSPNSSYLNELILRWNFGSAKSVLFGTHRWTISAPGIINYNPECTLMRTSLKLVTSKSMILGLLITIPGALILRFCPNSTLSPHVGL